jgi:hypothetical protein
LTTDRQTAQHRPLRALAVLIALLACWAGTGTAQATDPKSNLGVYEGGGAVGDIAGFEAWLGGGVGYVLDYLPFANWSEIENPWVADQWSGSKYQLVVSIPLIPSSGGSLGRGARGHYNRHFAEVARNLVNAGHANAIVRLGWEFNGNWYPWTIGSPRGPRRFIRYWRNIVRTMRAVPGAHFRFDWCPALDGSWYRGRRINPNSAYPGDRYVDFIGLDTYDQGWGPYFWDPAARWRRMVRTRYGLRWHRGFAAAHSKQVSFPEWGLVERYDGHGGGDNPMFLDNMYWWLSISDVAYHNYFHFDDRDGKHDLAHFPAGAARFRELFGADTPTVEVPGI